MAKWMNKMKRLNMKVIQQIEKSTRERKEEEMSTYRSKGGHAVIIVSNYVIDE